MENCVKMEKIIKLQINGKNINVNYKDIELFRNNLKRGKSNNDSDNNIRENIIYCIINKLIPLDWNKNNEWIELITGLEIYTDKLFNNNTKLSCIKVAGRKNYDFLIKNETESKTTDVKMEFKFGCSSVVKCPQFCSIPDKSGYDKFFYDEGYVKEISKLYNITEISREIYLKFVNQCNFEKDIWFKNMYEIEDDDKKKKKSKSLLVDKSIDKFLTLLVKSDNFKDFIEYTTNHLIDKHKGKKYACFNPKDKIFHFDEIDEAELKLKTFNGFDLNKSNLKHTLIFNTHNIKSHIHMLFRWKNRKGILYPAWQCKLFRNK